MVFFHNFNYDNPYHIIKSFLNNTHIIIIYMDKYFNAFNNLSNRLFNHKIHFNI